MGISACHWVNTILNLREGVPKDPARHQAEAELLLRTRGAHLPNPGKVSTTRYTRQRHLQHHLLSEEKAETYSSPTETNSKSRSCYAFSK